MITQQRERRTARATAAVESELALHTHSRQVLASSPREPALRGAVGRAIGHHGEILQGVFEQSDGSLVRGLVSLVTPLFRSEATFTPAEGAGVIVEPQWKTKARRAAELALEAVEAPRSGLLTINSRIEPRWGFGSSTCDVVATLRAVSAAVGRPMPPEMIAAIAVRAETASDSTMFGDRAVLFAQRRGAVVEDLGGGLPKVHVIGFNTDPTGIGVDTLTFPPARYSWWEIEAFRPLLGLLRQAVQRQDAGALGYVASASARINQRHLPMRCFDALERMAERGGALGVQVAHSGSVAGLLIADDDSSTERQAALVRYLAEIGISRHWRFSTRESGAMTDDRSTPLRWPAAGAAIVERHDARCDATRL